MNNSRNAASDVKVSRTRVYVIDADSAEKIHAGTLVYDEASSMWAFAYAPSFSGSIDPLTMPNSGGAIYPFNGETPPGVFADLLPGQFVEEKLTRMIPGYRDMDTMDKLMAIGSRVHKGIALEVGGNPAYGIDPRPNALADFDKTLARFGMADFFDHEEIEKFVRSSPDWDAYMHELKKSYSGQQPLFHVSGVDEKPYLLKLYNSNTVLNRTRLELVAQKTAAAAGARIPDIRLIKMKEIEAEALLIERFDTQETLASARAQEVMPDGAFEVKHVPLRTMSISAVQGIKSTQGLYYNSIARSLESLSGSTSDNQTKQCVQNKIDLFRHSLLNHAMNNVDNHGKNMSVVLKDGQWQMSPVYDMGFFSRKENMSISYYGEPPIHSADILDDSFIMAAWAALDVPPGSGDPMAIRDSVVDAIVKELPKEIVKAGIGFDAKGNSVSAEAKHIVRSVGQQSSALAALLTHNLQLELRNELNRRMAKTNERDFSAESTGPSA